MHFPTASSFSSAVVAILMLSPAVAARQEVQARRGVADVDAVVTAAPDVNQLPYGAMPMAFLTARDDSGFTPSIACSTSTDVQVQDCATTNTDTGETTCSQITQATMVCAAENICDVDDDGISMCMRRKDNLSADEIAISIFLALIFVSGVGTIIYLCVADRRADRKRKAAAEAAQIAKDNKMASEQNKEPVHRDVSNGSDAGPPHNPFSG